MPGEEESESESEDKTIETEEKEDLKGTALRIHLIWDAVNTILWILMIAAIIYFLLKLKQSPKDVITNAFTVGPGPSCTATLPNLTYPFGG